MPVPTPRLLLAAGLVSIACAPAFAQSDAVPAPSAPAAVPTQPVIALERTPNLIALRLHFVNGPGPHRLQVQDGAMNLLGAEGQAPVRFVVKVHAPSDIRYYPVTAVAADAASGRPAGLRVGRGLDIVGGAPAEELARAGLRAATYLGVQPMTR